MSLDCHHFSCEGKKTLRMLVTYEPTIKIPLLPHTKILSLPLIKLHLPSTKILLKYSKHQLKITKVSLPTSTLWHQITERLHSVAILSSFLQKYLPKLPCSIAKLLENSLSQIISSPSSCQKLSLDASYWRKLRSSLSLVWEKIPLNLLQHLTKTEQSCTID